jgi:hypothetical protein
MKPHYDKNGLEVVEKYGIFWSRNFDRFWELLGEVGDNPILVMYRGSQDRLKWFYRCRYPYSRSRFAMSKVFAQDDIYFFDPETQILYTE